MFSVGDILRSERTARGLELAEIGRRTRINLHYLAAIEADDLSKLPGAFFYKSFVRQYAAALGLDESRYAQELERVAAAQPEPKVPGQVAQGSRVPSVPPLLTEAASDRRLLLACVSFVAVLLGCSGFYAWWHKTPTAAKPVLSEARPVSVSVPIPQAAAAETAPIVRAPVQVDLATVEETWLSISSDGRQLFSGILEPKQTRTWEGKERARLVVGNAGGLDVKWNGKSIGPIGKRGEVRTIVFTRDGFEILKQQRPDLSSISE